MVLDRASCSCAQLKVTCTVEPMRVSICHCVECQKRTGSVFSTNARFPRGAVDLVGTFQTYRRTGDSGKNLTFHFCPQCGSTVFWDLDRVPDVIVVAVGAFAKPDFPAPRVSVYESRRHNWVPVASMLGLYFQRHDTAERVGILAVRGWGRDYPGCRIVEPDA
jgi:hypothetical protein